MQGPATQGQATCEHRGRMQKILGVSESELDAIKNILTHTHILGVSESELDAIKNTAGSRNYRSCLRGRG